MTVPEAAEASLADRRLPARPFPVWKSVGAAAIAIVAVGALIWIELGIVYGRRAVQTGRLEAARASLRRYLWLHPHDAEARLLAADAWGLDDDLEPGEAALAAIAHLQKIDDAAPESAIARMREGRYRFLILHQPTAAERLFRAAIRRDPDQFDSHYLLWKLLDMTERFYESEPEFREVLRLTPAAQKAYRLREWYLSQFAPLSACSELDGMMRFHGPGEQSSESVEHQRLLDFFDHEPDSPMLAAAIAQWHLRNGQADLALQALVEMANEPEAMLDRAYVASLAESWIESGDLQRASESLSRFPEPREGYKFWLLSGIIQQDLNSDYQAAVGFYDQAFKASPGSSDWQALRRKAHCLARLRQPEEAEKVRALAARIESLMELKVHQRIKEALLHLDDPGQLEIVANFYEQLNRTGEALEWRKLIPVPPQR